jgi:uncharacterized protein YggE
MRRHATTMAMAVLALLGALACGTGAAVAQAPARRAAGAPPTIMVQGTGKVGVRPDIAVAVVGVEARAPKLADATADVARRMTAVLGGVKALGVADRDLTTVAYSVEPLTAPQTRADEQPPRIAGYRVANAVQIKVRKLDDLGRVLEAALGAGANTLRGLHFTVDDPAAAEAEARARAVRDATAKARQLADAAGVKLGDLVFLSEGVAPPRPVFREFSRAAMAPAMAPGPVETGEQDITVTVEAHFSISR